MWGAGRGCGVQQEGRGCYCVLEPPALAMGAAGPCLQLLLAMPMDIPCVLAMVSMGVVQVL